MVQAGEGARIGIIGGGFAGLAAAAELEKNGIEYVLLEATDRLGGRVYPIKDSEFCYNWIYCLFHRTRTNNSTRCRVYQWSG